MKRQSHALIYVIVAGIAMVFLVYEVTVEGPRLQRALDAVRKMNQRAVSRVQIYEWIDVDSAPKLVPTTELSADQRARYLNLLSKARGFHPNHPQGGWAVTVEIDTDGTTTTLVVSATENNGTLVQLLDYPKGQGGASTGWLRNDDLGDFLDELRQKR